MVLFALFGRTLLLRRQILTLGSFLVLGVVVLWGGAQSASLAQNAVTSSGAASDFSPSTIQRIRNRGNVLVVGVAYDYAPFGSFNASGEAIGFEPDLAQAIAQQWGVEITFVPVSPSARIPTLLAGQIDLIAAALPHTAENEAQVDFSNHYFVDAAALLLPVESQTLDFAAFSGRTVAVVQDGSPMPQFTQYLAELQATVTLLPFQEHGPALRALAAGQADALLADYTYLTHVAADQSALSVILPLPGEEAFAFGLAPGDSLFRNMIDATLQELYTSGVYATLYARWFPQQAVPTLPTVTGEWPYTIANLPLQSATRRPSVLQQLRLADRVRVGVAYDLAPFGFLAENGELQGFDIDLAHEFARRWFGVPEALTPVRVTADTAIPLLSAGQIDLVAAALPDTWSNAAVVDFSIPYYTDALGVLVRHGEPPTTLAAFDNRSLATVGQTATQTQAALLFGRKIQPQLIPFQEYRAAEQALLAGQVDGLLGSTTALANSQRDYPQLQLLTEQRYVQSYGIGIPLGDDQMRDLVNLTLQVMKRDGTYEAIYRKWFTTPPYQINVWPDIAVDVDLTLGAQQQTIAPILQPTAAAKSVATAPLLITTQPAVVTAEPSSILLPTGTPVVAETAANPTPMIAPTAEAAVTPTPRLLFATNTTHRIAATDSLASIAQQYYGEQRLWTLIYEANRAIIGDDPNVIPVGAELVIPPKP